MRVLLGWSLALMFAPAALGQADKKVELIPVVDLKRTDPVSFNKDVMPIFEKKCTVCHSGRELKGDLDLGTYEGLVKGGKRGKAIIPGKGNDSLMYKLMRREMKPYMPPRGEDPITPEEMALVKLWIDQGAKAPTGVREKTKIVVGVPPANVTPVRAVAIDPQSKTPVVAVGRGNQIHLYDAATGNHVRSLTQPKLKTPDGKDVSAAHLSIVESLAFAPDGKSLVSGSFQEIAVWNPETGELIRTIPGFDHNVVALTFSTDGKLLATGGGEPTVDGEVKVFETANWKPVMKLMSGHSDTAYGVAFNPDAKMLATGSADKFIKVWEVPSAKFVKSFEGHTHHVLDVAWSADGKLIASAGGDNTVKVWDFEKGEQLKTINAHGKQATRVLFLGKKAEVVSAGGDNLVKSFNATSGAAAKSFPGAGDFVYAIAATADGATVVAGGQDGVVRVYNAANGSLLKTLQPPGSGKQDEKK